MTEHSLTYELSAEEQVAVLTACVKLLAEKLGIDENDLFNEAWDSRYTTVSMHDRRLNCTIHYDPPYFTPTDRKF